MTAPRLVGIAGSFNRPSKTLSLVRHVAALANARYGFATSAYDLLDVGPSLGNALWRRDLDQQAERVVADIVAADRSLRRRS
jgi:FMN reductase